MENLPKIAIILVNYNGTKDTLDCLNSLQKITYINYTVVVIENGSSDSEILRKAIEKKFPNVVYIKSMVNLGFSGGNNLGIEYAQKHSYDYVLLLNNDTVVAEDFLERMVDFSLTKEEEFIQTGKVLEYYYKDKIWYGGGNLNIEYAHIQHDRANTLDTGEKIQREVSFASGCLLLIPMLVIDRIGLLDESFFMYSEDADYCFRATRAGFKIIYNSLSVIYHKVSASSGGNGNKLSQYYRTRNDLILVSKYAQHKLVAYFFMTLRLIKRNIVGQFTIRPTLMGIIDFLHGTKGQKEIIWK